MELPTITNMLVTEIEVAYFNFKEILTIKIARMVSIASFFLVAN